MSNTVPSLIRGRLLDEAGREAPLAARVRHVAAALAARGFGPGDVLALWAPNIPAWGGVAFGAMAAGGAVTGVHPAASDRELAIQLQSSRASVVVTIPPLVERARAAGARDVIPIGPELLALPTAADPPPPDPDSLALLPYSSGTTGLPKGVMLTHRNLTAAMRQIEHGLGLTERDVVAAIAPFCHMMGFLVTLAAPLAVGATVVTLPRFDLEAIERHGVTVLVVPPPLMALLATTEAKLPSLELIVSGGAPLGAALQRAVAERFPHAAVAQGYGMTETAVAISGPAQRRSTVPGSVGRPMLDTEVKLVDGELWVRGPQVMRGYLGQPPLSGWLRTGDLGHFDADGNLFIAGRIKELIKVSGYQVAPAELEALLFEHEGVADAAVAGRPDPRTGEAPVAFVVPRGELDPESLEAWVAERVAPYKRLAAVELVDAIPRTPSGKIIRRALAAPPPRPEAALPR